MKQRPQELPTLNQVQMISTRFDPDSFTSERDADDLMHALYKQGFVLSGFDWQGWEEGRLHGEDRRWVGQLSFISQTVLQERPDFRSM